MLSVDSAFAMMIRPPGSAVQILVVDNENSPFPLHNLIADAAHPAEILRVAGADSAKDLLAIADPSPDIIVVDQENDAEACIRLLKFVRSDANLRRTPILVVSSDNSPHVIAQAYQSGANAFIRKPSSKTELEQIMTDLFHFWTQAVALPPRRRHLHNVIAAAE